MRHAYLLRESAAVIAAKSASALLYNIAVWNVVWVCGRVFCDGMSDVMGSTKRFRLSFWTSGSS